MSDERFCTITTAGRVTGNPHEIEVWYVRRAGTIYILMGGGERADTVRNLLANERATVRIGATTHVATGRIVGDEDEAAWVRRELPRKYAHEEEGLGEWAETALPVAFELSPAPSP